jgi:hypothetical protein
MKKIIFLLLLSVSAIAQDISPIVVNISDSPLLQYNGAFAKRKATVVNYLPLTQGSKEFSITVNIVYYVNNAGAYGATIQSDIAANATLSSDQQTQLSEVYKPFNFTYSTSGKCADQTTGALVNCFQADGTTPTVNAISDLAYWQAFKLNQISGVTSLTTNGAADVQYRIIQAIVAKLDSRKKW